MAQFDPPGMILTLHNRHLAISSAQFASTLHLSGLAFSALFSDFPKIA
jgi:hypothetical protein